MLHVLTDQVVHFDHPDAICHNMLRREKDCNIVTCHLEVEVSFTGDCPCTVLLKSSGLQWIRLETGST